MKNLLHPFKPWALATLVTGSLVSSPALADPVLWVSGDCPGDILVEVTEMDPYATVTVLYGERASGDGLDIPRGPCEGVETELASADRGFDLTDDDGDGEVSLVSTVDGTRCGTAFHVLDIDSCQISNLSYIEEHDGWYDSEAYDIYSTPDYYTDYYGSFFTVTYYYHSGYYEEAYLYDTRPSWFTWDYDTGYADTLYDTYFIEFYDAVYPGAYSTMVTYYDSYPCYGGSYLWGFTAYYTSIYPGVSDPVYGSPATSPYGCWPATGSATTSTTDAEPFYGYDYGYDDCRYDEYHDDCDVYAGVTSTYTTTYEDYYGSTTYDSYIVDYYYDVYEYYYGSLYSSTSTTSGPTSSGSDTEWYTRSDWSTDYYEDIYSYGYEWYAKTSTSAWTLWYGSTDSTSGPSWLTWDYDTGYTETLYASYYTHIYDAAYAYWGDEYYSVSSSYYTAEAYEIYFAYYTGTTATYGWSYWYCVGCTPDEIYPDGYHLSSTVPYTDTRSYWATFYHACHYPDGYLDGYETTCWPYSSYH